jgi:iron complex transport system permease protein
MSAGLRPPHLILLVGAAMLPILAALFIGPAAISPGEAISALFGGSDEKTRLIIMDIRLPRALAAFLVGAMLGASGAGLQGLLRNPLADPGVLGVSSMAALGGVVAVFFNLSASVPLATPLAAVLAALCAVFILFAAGAARLSPTRLILVGVGLSSFSGALIALVINLAPNPFTLADLMNWLFGAVANRSLADIALVLPFMIAGGAALFLSGRGLSALSLGEETATAIGADLKMTRALAIGGAALLTGASVALAGAVGFVGVVAPHLARPLVRHDPGAALLPAALIGGGILAAADFVIRLLPFSPELKLGVAAALIGAPVFLLIAAASERITR